MESVNERKVLVSGASIAGLSTAYWLSHLGYHVIVVELASEIRKGGAAINVQGNALAIAKRIGILKQLQANRLQLERWEFKNAENMTEGSLILNSEQALSSPEEVEIERDKLITILANSLQDKVDFLFNNRITALHETEDAMHVSFSNGESRTFDLVFGCDGLHSGVRKLWFGHETTYAHFMKHYFSLTIVNKLLIEPNTAQIYNVPC